MSINYIDQYGRWHVKPVTDENPLPTNNAYIYTFYAGMVGLPFTLQSPVANDLLDCQFKPLNRHPGIMPPEAVPISHDEYVGAAGMQSDGQVARFICEYGERNYWQFCDIPGFTPTPFRKLVIDDVMAAYEDLANEENPRTAVIKYPALYPLAFYHRPDVQYFYYRCAGRSPGIFRTLFFIFAVLHSIFKKDQTSPMLFFKFLKFRKLGPTFIEKLLDKLYCKKVDYKNMASKYFPEDHPILAEVKKL